MDKQYVLPPTEELSFRDSGTFRPSNPRDTICDIRQTYELYLNSTPISFGTTTLARAKITSAMSVSDKSELQLDEEMRKLTRDLDEKRKRRRLIELREQLAEEEYRLQEAQQRLDNASHRASTAAFDSASQSPVDSTSPVLSKSSLSTAPVPDIRNSVDALIASVLNPIIPSVNKTMPTNIQTAANNSTSGNDHALQNHKRARSETTSPQRRQTAQPASLETPIHPISASQNPTTPPNPLGLKLGSYLGRNWKECILHINTLESHFTKYPSHYTEARKVQLGARYIGHSLMHRWHEHTRRGNASWNSYCTFLAQQLSRRASREEAISGMKTAKQKFAQPVTHFALWLIQWAPVLPEVSAEQFMKYLLTGALDDIRVRASRSYAHFSDYFSYTAYLQEIENSIPARAKICGRLKHCTIPTDGHFVSVNTNEYHADTRDILPGEYTQRATTLRPTEVRSQVARQLQPEVPLPRGLPVYSTRSWWLCKAFISQLQRHFDKYGDHCKEYRKVEIARDNLLPLLRDKWDVHATRLSTVTWFAFCVFLVDQIPSEGAGNFRHPSIYQRHDQSVYTFALELLRRNLDISAPKDNRRRHLWDRVLPEIRYRARKTWEDFDDFHVFVAYLQQVQDSFSMPQHGEDRDSIAPRKHFRINRDT